MRIWIPKSGKCPAIDIQQRRFFSVRKVYVLCVFIIHNDCLILCAVDILRLLFLHVYCFYAYARRLTLSQLTGCLALSRLFRGKKYNPLRDRQEGCLALSRLFRGKKYNPLRDRYGGCLALSRLFRGKKYNPLRDRYEGCLVFSRLFRGEEVEPTQRQV